MNNVTTILRFLQRPIRFVTVLSSIFLLTGYALIPVESPDLDRRYLPSNQPLRSSHETTALKQTTFVNSIGMKLVEVKRGAFFMGFEGQDAARDTSIFEWDELPRHPVNISKSFYMSATPVTNAQFEQFDPDHRLLRGKRGLSHHDDEAVVFVSWYDAVAFTQWLSEKEGKPYRLPTEAEWEYACRAGTTTAYNFGDAFPPEYHLNQKKEWYPQPVDLTVGKNPANDWGLFNMHGLVEEWCMDWYGPYSERTQTDPVGYAEGNSRVTRGGSHNTELPFLRSANRSGMLPEDKNFMVGFRVVQAEAPSSKPLAVAGQRLWAKNINQKDVAWKSGVNMEEPYFEKPVYFQNVPPGLNGPLYSSHNHCPDITALPNGDLFATWYSTNTEQGRELTVVASRLRRGTSQWDAPDVFYKVPDRNMHATSIWWDKPGKRIYHFQGIGISTGWGDLALMTRTSEDNGVTWSKPHWINREHGLRNMPIAGVIQTADGSIIVKCDAVTGGDGGSAIHVSKDNGITWYDPGAGSSKPTYEEGGSGGTIAGIHAGVVSLKDGRLLAFGRGDQIQGRMPMSMSDDLGKTWTYSASPFPPIGGGQRLALTRLREGPIMLVSFTNLSRRDTLTRWSFTHADGRAIEGLGMYAALSYDEGKTWSVRKLLTPGEGTYDGGAWTDKFSASPLRAEHAGYLAVTQTPDGIIHLISSRLHYRFNLKWIETPAF